MKEADFGIQYKAELDTLHAPKALIEATKEKVLAETALETAKRRKRRYMYVTTMTAAAALVLVVGVLAFNGSQKASGIHGEDMQLATDHQENMQAEGSVQQAELFTGTTIYLGENKEEIYLEEQIEIDRTAVLPMEFLKNTAWEEEISGTQVMFTVDNEGNYIAAYEEAEAYVVVYSQSADVTVIKECIQQILAE